MSRPGNIHDELKWRGLIFQESGAEGLRQYLTDHKITVYAGFDPTSDSLHVGNLVPLIALRRFQDFGHTALPLAGGATGLIGDPSGKSAERNLQTPETVEQNLVGIRKQLARIVDLTPGRGTMVNNYDWTSKIDLITYLRDIGKFFSVNAMMAKDSVSSRLEGSNAGISYTEFSYMILQGYDFYHLFKEFGCSLQIGGSDQWGNMTAGMELVRRKGGGEAHCLTLPLITTADGKKFGKSERGAIWLDPKKTCPYEFYQYWFNAADADACRFLKLFTFLDQEQIAELETATAEAPHLRTAQRRLAQEMTDLIHGKEATVQAESAAAALFGQGEISSVDEATLAALVYATEGKTYASLEDVQGILQIMVENGLAKSNSQARDLVKPGGVSANNVKVPDERWKPAASDLLHGRFLVVRKGKRDFKVIRFG